MSKGQVERIDRQQKILILAAIPRGLRLDKEINEIEEAIRRAAKRDLFEIRIRTAVRSQNIRRAIAEEKPQIVHFCGHGLKDGSLMLEDEGGHNKSVSPKGLASLFQLHSNNINCVLLNACHSAKTAEAISKYINYVIGMNQPIGDRAAIAFAQGFYDGLGYVIPEDQDVFQRAFEEGKVAIELEISDLMPTRKLIVEDEDKSNKIPEHLIPVLLKNPQSVSIANDFEDKLETQSQRNDAVVNKDNKPLIEVQKSPEDSEDEELQVSSSSVDRQTTQPQKSITNKISSVLPSKRHFWGLLSRSLAVTVLLMGVRYLGGLQAIELWAFDQLIRLRSSIVRERRDPRLLIVTIDEDDIRYQNERGMKMHGSLSDEALGLLLNKLEQAQTIGLDIYRDYDKFNQANLLTELQQNQHFFIVCKVEDSIGDDVASLKGIPNESIVFSDVVNDKDGIVRRHLLSLDPPIASDCQAKYSLGTLLALDYLNAKEFAIDTTNKTSEKHLQIGGVTLKPMKSHTSGYQGIDAKGYQILLNYRSMDSLQQIADSVPLREVLKGKIEVEGKIVLIGVTAPSFGDHDWQTPHGEKIPGVFLQAHMASQIVSAVEDKRSLLWVWSLENEVLWVWGWSLVGGAIACGTLRSQTLIMAEITALGILVAVCFSIFLRAGWIPLIPPILALIITGGVTIAISHKPSQENNR